MFCMTAQANDTVHCRRGKCRDYVLFERQQASCGKPLWDRSSLADHTLQEQEPKMHFTVLLKVSVCSASLAEESWGELLNSLGMISNFSRFLLCDYRCQVALQNQGDWQGLLLQVVSVFDAEFYIIRSQPILPAFQAPLNLLFVLLSFTITYINVCLARSHCMASEEVGLWSTKVYSGIKILLQVQF